MDIKFIEIMSSDFKTYRIDKDNIVECNCIIKNILVDCIDFEDKENVEVPLVESLLLIINNYNDIKDDENNKLDIKNQNISQILIYNEDDTIQIGYVNLTTEDYNKNQNNYLEDDRLYITIEDEI